MARIMGAAARPPPDEYVEANILSAYNLCSSLPFEELTASPSSAYVLSILLAELTVSMETTGIFMCKITGGAITASPASAYSLSTAVT